MKARILMVMALVGGSWYAHAQDSARPRSLLPHHVKLQYAGGIGFFSLGAGYHNRKEKLEGDLYYGYVPESVGGVEIHILTGKLTWHVARQQDWGPFQVKPLSLGLWVSYTFGKQYFLFSPENFPLNYYGYPTALHLGGFVGGRISKQLGKQGSKRLGLYYELGSNDIEIVSYVNNREALHIADILNLAIGVRWAW